MQLDTLLALASQNTLTVISADSELPLQQWRTIRKKEVTIQELLDPSRLNLLLRQIDRSPALPCASVSLLATHPLGSFSTLDQSSNHVRH
ncbi:MAG: hypothetical protein ACSHX8_08505 [Opitutaceae bacterium]